nr:glycosyltransferase family 4 protein [Candidatus Freyarchaeota archaeon]
MKILQVTTFFTPRLGGSVIVPYSFSMELSKRGHEVTLLTTDYEFDEKYAKNLEKEGVKVIPFHCITDIQLFLITPRMKNWLKKEIRNFDVIHLHAFRSYQNVIAHYYAKRYEIPYVLQAHGSAAPSLEKRKLKKLYDLIWGYKILKDASKAIALTKTEVEQYKKMGLGENKIEIIPNGINPSEYQLPPKGRFKTKYRIKDDEKIVLYLGRIHRSKGIDLLINSFDVLTRTLDNVKLVVLGPDDGFLNEALSMSKKLGSKVLFKGFVNAEEKLEALTDADVFVTPMFNGFPLTFLEACIAGLPIVTTQLGDVLNWVNNRVGFVSTATPEDLAKAIYKILYNNSLREKFSQNCREIVYKEFSIDNVVTKLENLYRNLIIK